MSSVTNACSGQSFTLTAVTSNCGTGLQYQWSTGENFSSITTAVVNSTNSPINATYTVTVTGSAGSSSASKIISVRPIPDMTINNLTPQVCDGDSTLIALSSNATCANFNWLVIPSGVSGAVNGGGHVIKHKLQNTGSGIGNVKYIVTPRCGSCYGTPDTTEVAVYNKPGLMISAMDTIVCSNSTIQVSLSSDQPDAVFSWTSNASSVTGNTNGSGTVINDLLLNQTADTAEVTYWVQAFANGCYSPVSMLKIYVLPSIYVQFSSVNPGLCSGDSLNIQLTSVPAGADFSWNFSTTNVTGATNGTGNLITQVLNTVSNPGKIVYHVTGELNQCLSNVFRDTVTVRPLPETTFDPILPVCSGSMVSISLYSNYANSQFYWFPLPSNISGATAGSGNVISQVLFNSQTLNDTLHYAAYSVLNGCDGPVTDIPVIVKPVPQISCVPQVQTICSGSSAVIQINVVPSAATVSWNANPVNVNGAYNGSGTVINQLLSTTAPQGNVSYEINSILNGCAGDMQSAEVTVLSCTGMGENIESTGNQWSQSNLTIHYANANNERISARIIDYTGRVVQQTAEQLGPLTISISKLDKGIYFLYIQHTGWPHYSIKRFHIR